MKPYSRSRLKKSLMEARSRKLSLLFLVGLQILSLPFAFLLPFPLKLAVDSVIGGKPLPAPLAQLPLDFHRPDLLLLLACAGTLLIMGLQAGAAQLSSLYEQFVWESLILDLRLKLFRHLQRMSFRYHGEKGSAALFYHLENDVRSMQSLTIQGLIPICTSAVTFSVMFCIAWRLDWELAVLALAVVPILWAAGRWYSQKSRARWETVKKSENLAMGSLQEALGRISTIQYFRQEERELSSYHGRARGYLESFVHTIRGEALYSLGISFVFSLVSAASLFLGIRHVQNGSLSLGNFLVVSAYLVQLLRPLEIFSRQVASIQASLASADRVRSVLEEVPEIKAHPRPLKMQKAGGKIEFRAVDFSYAPQTTALKQLSFTIPAGSKAGLIGSTGAGKSTLIALLGRFLDPTAGGIFLDDVNLRELDLESLRAQFAYVPQEPVLLKGTIAENISYGRPRAKQNEIWAAADAACATEFIQRLPQGFDTIIGDRGHSLSGGERQRIALAMAYLTEAPILVLDEATSALDLETESAIAHSLRAFGKGRTILAISHRLSLLRDFDLVLTLEKGSLVGATEKR